MILIIKITSPQTSNWDSESNGELPKPSLEFLKRTEAAMGMLQLQQPEIDVITMWQIHTSHLLEQKTLPPPQTLQ